MKEIKHIFVYVNPAKKLCTNYCEYLFFNERIFSTEVQNSLSLYSIFMHFCFCKRRCNIKGRNNYCTLCSKVITQSCDDKVLFKEILIDFRDFSNSFLAFSRGHSLMAWSIFYHSNRWLTKYKKQKCKEFYHIKEPFKFLKLFLNIMVRIYLNKTIQILDKVNVSHHEYIFIRRICWQAYELMSDFLFWHQCWLF